MSFDVGMVSGSVPFLMMASSFFNPVVSRPFAPKVSESKPLTTLYNFSNSTESPSMGTHSNKISIHDVSLDNALNDGDQNNVNETVKNRKSVLLQSGAVQVDVGTVENRYTDAQLSLAEKLGVDPSECNAHGVFINRSTWVKELFLRRLESRSSWDDVTPDDLLSRSFVQVVMMHYVDRPEHLVRGAVQRLDFHGLENVEVLALHFRTLDEKTFLPMKKLRELSLFPMAGAVVDDLVFKYTPQLNRLNVRAVSNGSLMEPFLRPGMFKYLNSLMHLYIISPRDVFLSSGLFDGLDQLKILQIKGAKNFDDTLLKGLSNLRILRMVHGDFKTLSSDFLQNVGELTSLVLSSNNLKHLPDNFFQYTSKLKILDLSSNRFSLLSNDTKHDLPINFTAYLPHLKELLLFDNPLVIDVSFFIYQVMNQSDFYLVYHSELSQNLLVRFDDVTIPIVEILKFYKHERDGILLLFKPSFITFSPEFDDLSFTHNQFLYFCQFVDKLFSDLTHISFVSDCLNSTKMTNFLTGDTSLNLSYIHHDSFKDESYKMEQKKVLVQKRHLDDILGALSFHHEEL